MSSISIRGVAKSYGNTPVIHDLDVEIAEGEFIVVVGPSGCGKSTLLRMIAGLERITGGEIAIGQRVVNELEPKDRDIAMVFQNYALYPHMSVFDNMAYGLKIAGLPREEIRRRVDRAAAILELAEFLERKPRQLSGGQRQRVAMGRAIVRNPSVFLFDEPLSNLDAKLRVQMRLEIKQLQRSLGTTSVYVTHDQVEAMTLADRLIVMNAGVAEQIDTPLAVYGHPASRFVAGFIGSPAMNFLEATLTDDGSHLGLTTGDRLTLDHRPDGLNGGQSVTLGLRPEDLLLCQEPEASLHLQVEMVEPLGADTLVHGRLSAGNGAASRAADTTLVSATAGLLTLRLPGTAHFSQGERLPLTAASESLHLFDQESGRRLF